MGDVFQEVDEDIRKDRIKSIWKRYRIFFILLLLFVIGAVCFNSFWTQYKLKKVEERSEKYFFAMDEATINAQKGVDALKIFSVLYSDIFIYLMSKAITLFLKL